MANGAAQEALWRTTSGPRAADQILPLSFKLIQEIIA